MKRKYRFLIYPLFLTGAFLMLMNGCSDDTQNSLPDQTNGKTTAVFNPNLIYGTMSDIDGNEYKTITIGTQTWMAQNLRVTKFRNGDPIPNVTENAAWASLSTAACCSYSNTAITDDIATYGRLYNWYAVAESRNIAPTGWHVPNEAEWTTLTTYLGGLSGAGDKLKEIGTTHWRSTYSTATNESGFTALPGGGRTEDGTFFGIGGYDYWWGATEHSLDYAYYWYVQYSVNDLDRDWQSKKYGYSIRCVRD